MATIFPGRYTAATDKPFVVFIIGMRVNQWWALHKWIPTALAMGPMLRTLYAHQQEKGFLAAQPFLYGRGVALVQYWRSFEDLERFARSKDDSHLKAWQRFNKAIGGDGSVGIFHETYQVQPGEYEAIYGNMPVFGLASAVEHTRIAGRRETARGRLGLPTQPSDPQLAEPALTTSSREGHEE